MLRSHWLRADQDRLSANEKAGQKQVQLLSCMSLCDYTHSRYAKWRSRFVSIITILAFI